MLKLRKMVSSRGFVPWALLCLLFAGCSADSPSEPSQPAPPSGDPEASTWNITVDLTPDKIPAGGDDTVTVQVRVRAKDTGAPPANGTTVVLAATAGSFTANVVELRNGRATTTFIPPAEEGAGSVTIQAQLEGDVGQATLRLLEPQTFFIGSVEPNSGSPNGGEEVSVRGGGFERPVRVTFGDVPAQVLSVSSSRIRVETPPFPGGVEAGESESVGVAVTINLNEEDQATDNLGSAFTYSTGGSTIKPAITSVTPASGPNEGGTRVRIRGDGFRSPVQVVFGATPGLCPSLAQGVEATVEQVSNSEIVMRTPAAQGFGTDLRNKDATIAVKNLDSGLCGEAPSAFRYGIEMVITAISPNEVPQNPSSDDLVTIFGQGFEEPLIVEVGSVQQQVISVTGTEVVFRPEPFKSVVCGTRANGGTVSVTLINSGQPGPSASGPSLFYTGPDQFLITGLSPTSGPQTGGTRVTISGSGFEDPVRVVFGEQAGSVESVSANSVTVTTPQFTGTFAETSCTTPEGEPGTRKVAESVDLKLTSLETECSDSLPSAFSYEPTDTTCIPDSTDGGDGVTAAFGFTTVDLTADFEDQSTGDIISWQWDFGDGSSSTVRNPSHTYASSGTFTVELTVTDGTDTDSTTQDVTVTEP